MRAAAFALSALVLLVPANLLPILEIEYMGRTKASTVWGGCVALWDEGMWAEAALVFIASIAIPFLKLLAIFILCWLDGSGRLVASRVWTLRQIERIGRWSMLDVFLLAVLVALVQMESLSSAHPGAGLFFRSDQLAFARAGVPAVFLNTGDRFRGRPADYGATVRAEYRSQHYHQPSDELRPGMRFDGLLQQTRVAFRIGHTLATTPGLRPAWRAGEAFGETRRASETAVGR